MFFELSRACEVESGMAPEGIVEPVDIAANSLVGLLAGVEDGPPDELGFQGLEERLDHGVVIAIPLAGHRDQDGVLVELGLIIDRAILAAAIGVMDQPCFRTAHGQGFAQSGKSQVAMQPVAGCPANHPSCEQVDNDGEVEPAFAGPDIGNVGAPLFVGPCGGEVLIEQVRRDWPSVTAVRGPLEPPLLPSPQAVVAHQASRPATPDPEAAIPQFPRHPGTTVGAVRQGKGRSDMRQQHHVVALAATGWPTSPGEIAALADAEHATQAVDGELRFRPIDEREPHRLPSRAKKAVAFFRAWPGMNWVISVSYGSVLLADKDGARRCGLKPPRRSIGATILFMQATLGTLNGRRSHRCCRRPAAWGGRARAICARLFTPSSMCCGPDASGAPCRKGFRHARQCSGTSTAGATTAPG